MCDQERDYGEDALRPGPGDVVMATFACDRGLRRAGWEAADELNFSAGESMFGKKGVLKFQAKIVEASKAVMFDAAGAAITWLRGGAST